jgi:hypothetical protein
LGIFPFFSLNLTRPRCHTIIVVFVLKLATVELSNNLETELFYSDSRIKPAGLLHINWYVAIIVYAAVIFQDTAY